MHIGLHIKYPLFFSDFNKIWILSTYFRKILEYQVSWKSVQWKPSCSFRTERRTDMTNWIAAFRNSAKALEKLCNFQVLLGYILLLAYPCIKICSVIRRKVFVSLSVLATELQQTVTHSSHPRKSDRLAFQQVVLLVH